LWVACPLGLVGLLLLLAVAGPPLVACFRRAAAGKAPLEPVAAWLGLVVHGLADSALHRPGPLLLAVGWLALARPGERRPRPAPAGAGATARGLSVGLVLAALVGLWHTTRQALSDACLVRGLRAAAEGRPAEARHQLSAGLHLAADPTELLFYRGVLRAELGRPDGAARDLRRSFSLVPTPERATALGNLELRRGHADRAVRWYRRAIALHPRYTPAYNNLGVAHLRLGDRGAARRHLLRARSLRPGDARVNRSWSALEAAAAAAAPAPGLPADREPRDRSEDH
jgi:tetratricopeptide (TPR) repeat protein